ncbi:MAG: CoA pyrophosphatase [Halanaerobacter sp.]
MEEKLDDLKARLNDKGIIGKERKYFNSAVLIPLLKIDNEPHLLFQRRAEEISQPNEICFPGGEYDKRLDGDYKETALRETREELGIKEDSINLLGKLGTIVVPVGLSIDAFVAEVDIANLEELKLNYDEVVEVFTISLAYFKDNEPQKHYLEVKMHPYDFNQEGEKVTLLPVEEYGLPKRYSTPWSGRRRNIFIYPTEKGVIWGITAELITELINELEDGDFI